MAIRPCSQALRQSEGLVSLHDEPGRVRYSWYFYGTCTTAVPCVGTQDTGSPQCLPSQPPRPRPSYPPAQQAGKGSALGIFGVGSRDHIFATVLGRVFFHIGKLWRQHRECGFWVFGTIDNFCTDCISFLFVFYSLQYPSSEPYMGSSVITRFLMF